jgi:hypothetical protein
VNIKTKGLGDTIANVTNRLGIHQCGGCKKRQRWLNEKVPYNNNLNILTDALFKSKTKRNN